MKLLFKGGRIVNVFTGECPLCDVLVENDKIIAIGDIKELADYKVVDVRDRLISPGFIDGHIHIESTMLSPAEFARACVTHGTTAVIADPHEIANVAGVPGIKYMLEASEGLPVSVYIALPSCVPATAFCESGATLSASELEELYGHERVVALGEVMNYFGVINRDSDLMQKIADAKRYGRVVNGHAPLLTGEPLSSYVAAGIKDDHECTSFDEAAERISLGQRVMIRQGTAAKNLDALLPLFDTDAKHRCLLVSDDKHPADLIALGHLDEVIRRAVHAGKNVVDAVRMASLNAAEHFGIKDTGAIAPGYYADIVVFDSAESLQVQAVYKRGVLVAEGGTAREFDMPKVSEELEIAVRSSFKLDKLSQKDFEILSEGKRLCRVISIVAGELLTEQKLFEIDFGVGGGSDTKRDILKLAVIERHKSTGHIGLGYVHGAGLKCGAIASSVSHDSHNLIVIGVTDSDMAAAANRIRELGGGLAVVKDGVVIAQMPLSIAGLMTDAECAEAARQNEEVRAAVYELGAPSDIEPFMNMAFVSLPVIPHLKMTTHGLVDVGSQKLLPLFVDEA